MRKTILTLAAIGAAATVTLSLQLTCATAAEPNKIPCTGPTSASKLERSLVHTAERLRAHEPITIIAIGSSSTAGAGASSPAASYPARLEAELRLRFPDEKITVLNRGINGEIGTDMIARFDKDVFADKPDLVLWQVGANSVLRDQPLGPAGDTIRDGIKRLKDSDVDVVLIDPQYSPKMIAHQDAEGMIELISATAKEAGVAVFRRFSIMRHWKQEKDLSFETFVTPDGIHMNDWGYDCWAKLLSNAIADAATRQPANPAGSIVTSVSLRPKTTPPTR
jgi:lysophospholipase L1-like esterase